MINLAKLKNVLTLDVFTSKSEQRDKVQRASNGQSADTGFDGEAFQSIPPDSFKEDYDPVEYEFSHLAENPTAADVHETCEKRKRSLEALIDSLVFHVSKNSDQLSKGLGTVGDIEALLVSAAQRAQSARTNLLSTSRDAHANLLVSLLNRRRLNLHALKELSDKVLVTLQTEAAIREHIEQRHLWLAVNDLVQFKAAIHGDVISKLQVTKTLHAKCGEIERDLQREMDSLLEVVCVSFKEGDFASLLSTHIRLDSKGGTFVSKVKRKFEYLLDSKLETCFMQQQVAKMVLAQGTTGSSAEPNPFTQSIQQLCKRLRGAKFATSVEQILYNLFQILCSYHQMAVNSSVELKHVHEAVEAVKAGSMVRINEVGLPVLPGGDDPTLGESPDEQWQDESGGLLGDAAPDGRTSDLAPDAQDAASPASGIASVSSSVPASPAAPADGAQANATRAVAHRRELTDYLSQRCSILSELSDMMHKMRQSTWIQVQSIVRDLYWSREDIPGQMFSPLLTLGLKFSDMGLAFLNDDPLNDALASAKDELSATHDLEDIVVQRCGEHWFRSMHQGHLSLFLNEFLPGETWNITPYEIDGPTTPSLATALRRADTRHGPSIEQQSFEVWSNNPSAISKRARHVLLLHDESQPHSNGQAPSAHGTPFHRQHSMPAVTEDDSSSMTESQAHASEGPSERPQPAAAPHRAHAVCVMATVHILRLWGQYGSLLPALKRSASLHIFVAIKGLFEEYMLYIAKNFAAITPEVVLRGLSGIDSKFFSVVKRMMEGAADPSDRRAMAAILEAEQRAHAPPGASGMSTGMSTMKKWTTNMTANMAAAAATRMEEDPYSRSQRMGGTNLYGLFEGINACDALATLAQELRLAEPLLKKYQRDGDATLHARIQELYDKEGSLNEVPELRRRCVRGSVERKLDTMKQETLAALNKTCYNVKGVLSEGASPRREWVDLCKRHIETFAIQLSSCQDRRGIKEVWQEAIKMVNDVVLDGLAICLTDRTAMDKLLTAGAAARRGINATGCQWLQDDIVRLSSNLSDLLKMYAPDGIREEAMSLFSAIEWVWGAGGVWKAEEKDHWERWICKTCGIVRPERVLALFQARINMEGSKNSPWVKDVYMVAQAFM